MPMKKLFLFFVLLFICQIPSNSSGYEQLAPSETLRDDQEPANMKGMVAVHNKWRKALGLPPLVWSNKLAAEAQKWANKLKRKGCKMQHSSSSYGENLYWSMGMLPTPEDVVDSWASERKFFNFKKKQCKGNWAKCGHYTQVIWRNTKKVGCAMVKCGDEQVWVCNYDPPGNYSGEKPY